ncbi:MAG TPA: GNVR domain-containing protein, partial [Candidatus Polarisedimenticolaceae bacterium]|nr:GNVR domain-containing protein [Candidatus Polarisedimenticolaceae bacterium]
RPRDLEGELQQLGNEEARLRREIAAYQGRIETAPLHEQKMLELMQEYQTTQELYNSLRKRDEDARLTERLERSQLGETFRLLDAAVPPEQPDAPHRGQLLLLGLVASLAVALSTVVLAERRDPTFHGVDALRAFCRVPVLASIPPIVTPQDRRRARLRRGAYALLVLALCAGLSAAAFSAAWSNEDLSLLLTRSHP